MYKNYKSMLTACFFLTSCAFAQNEIDALRYSQHSFGTTARSLSMGGAFGALGADFSSLSINPAGIAFYRRGEFTVSTVFELASSNSNYINKSTTDNNANFGIGNLGLVWGFPREKKKEGWMGTAFGFGYNRINSFAERISFEGINTKNSMLDYFAELANGTDYATLADDEYTPLPFDATPAYNLYLIDTAPGYTNLYNSATATGNLRQRGLITNKGSQGEIVFSFGGNYDNTIYIGGTLGIPYFNFSQSTVYEEFDDDKTIDDSTSLFNFKNFKYVNDLSTQGTGVNLKVGLIYKVNDMLRFGLAAHTPTYYRVNDQYSSTMSAAYEDAIVNGDVESPDGKYSYSLITPFKAVASAAFLYQTYGLLSVDYEYTDYSTAKLNSDEDNFSDANRTISNLYTYGQNIRVGAEIKYKVFSFRGGVALGSNPFNGKFDFADGNLSSISYTGGVGLRDKKFFFDLAYAYKKYNSVYTPYTLNEQETESATIKNVANRVMLTFGIKF